MSYNLWCPQCNAPLSGRCRCMTKSCPGTCPATCENGHKFPVGSALRIQPKTAALKTMTTPPKSIMYKGAKYVLAAPKKTSGPKKTYVFIQNGHSGPFYLCHIKGCKDIAKEIQRSSDPSRPANEWPTITTNSKDRNEIAKLLAADLYGDDETTLKASDIDFKNCAK